VCVCVRVRVCVCVRERVCLVVVVVFPVGGQKDKMPVAFVRKCATGESAKSHESNHGLRAASVDRSGVECAVCERSAQEQWRGDRGYLPRNGVGESQFPRDDELPVAIPNIASAAL
jgi:hypothetical protein